MSIIALFQAASETHAGEAGAGAGAGAGGGAGGGIVGLVIAVLMVVSIWKVFAKAGEPGWAAIVPIYNTIVLLKIAGKPIWWIVLLIIPVVNLISLFIVAVSIAQRFGKGTGFGVGLALLPFVFYPMLAFGDAQYQSAPAGNS